MAPSTSPHLKFGSWTAVNDGRTFDESWISSIYSRFWPSRVAPGVSWVSGTANILTGTESVGLCFLEQPCCLIHHHLILDGRQCCSNVLFLLGGNQSSGSLIERRNNLDICCYRCTGSRLAFFSKSQCDSQSITQSKHEVSPFFLFSHIIHTTSIYYKYIKLLHTIGTYN